jgi:anti-sigma regulatory factor (Ser/Thr protein kinase)
MVVDEAVRNAIEHAHGLRPRPLAVELQRGDGEIVAVVRDGGAWRAAGRDDRGRGLPLMRAPVSDVRIDRGRTGPP